MKPDITVLILTYNEEANIGRTLNALSDFPEVVVLDSFSTDQTIPIAQSFYNVRTVSRPFDTHTEQWNFGLKSCGIASEWVLALDADYLISKELATEILTSIHSSVNNGFWMTFNYAIEGKIIKSGIYPAVLALFRGREGEYVYDGHTQRLHLNGKTGELKNKAIHDDRKPFSRWMSSQLNYAKLEATYLLEKQKTKKVDKLRKTFPFTPILVFLYCIFIRRGFRDGRGGWMYAWQRLLAEILLQYELLLRRTDK